jgi:hypothetical protein
MGLFTRTRAVLAAAVLTVGIGAAGYSVVDTGSPRAAAAEPSNRGHQASNPGHARGVAELQADFRKLWEDHITWTRLFIVSAVAGTADTDANAQRLLQNQVDIGNAIKPFYGDAAGEALTALLRDHILVASDLVGAAKANDSAKVTATSAAWYANADDIAAFLSNANPKHWPASETRAMMHEHLDFTLAEATHHLNGDYAASVADYDHIHEQILHMADTLSAGIAAQFPAKVAK